MEGKSNIVIACIIAFVVLLIIGVFSAYSFRDQSSLLLRKDKCATVGGIYIDTAQMEGCIRFVSVGQ